MGNRLNPGESLSPNGQLTAPTKPLRLVLQDDGNLVLYVWNDPLWDSKTTGQPAAKAVMQQDGNFVIYDNQGKALWSSNTWGKNGSYLELDDSGSATIYHPVGASKLPVWSTNTPFSFGWPKHIDSGPVQVAHNEFVQVTVSLSNTGRIDGETHIWTQNALYGFTGGTTIIFYDNADNSQWNTQMHHMGVDGTWIPGLPSSRNELWFEQMPQGMLGNIARLEAWCLLTPQPRLIQDLNELLDIGLKVADIYSKIQGGAAGAAKKTTTVGPGGGKTGGATG
jgi:hypothetical protein